ncbi:MAG: hypothetical protein KF704_01980 [Crocinitomicaceae bacterium]|nr:hypothetical protein [Crocinitomicaceae bacterium]
MLSGITWGEYLAAMGILIALYYGYVGVRYYPEELKRIFSGKTGRNTEQSSFGSRQFMQELEEDDDAFIDEHIDEDGDDEFREVETLITSLTQAIEHASKKKMIPAEFKQYLKGILREQPTLKDSPFRSSINELIVSECGKLGTFTLSEKEIDVLWDGAV